MLFSLSLSKKLWHSI